MSRKNKGFTLIEMLVVIAVIAVLVSILLPQVKIFMNRSSAAVDAANLKSVLDIVNAELTSNEDIEAIAESLSSPGCKTDSSAKIKICYDDPAALNAYFVNGDIYYSIRYLSEVAETGVSELPLTFPDENGVWYEIGVGTSS